MKIKAKHPLIAIVLTLVFVSAALGVGTMAYFTSSDSTPAESGQFMAGTLKIGSSPEMVEQLTPVTIENLQPLGPTQQGTINVENVGTLPAKIYFMECDIPQAAEGVDLATVLNMDVDITDDQTGATQHVYNGKLDVMEPGHGVIYFDPIYLMEPGQSATVYMNVTMDASAGNEYQGKAVENCVFTMHAKQIDDLIAGEEPGNTGVQTVVKSTQNFNVKIIEFPGLNPANRWMNLDIDAKFQYPPTFSRTDTIYITKRTPDGAEIDLGYAQWRWIPISGGWQIQDVVNNLGMGVMVIPDPVHQLVTLRNLEDGSYAIKVDVDYQAGGTNLDETTGYFQYLYNTNESSPQ